MQTGNFGPGGNPMGSSGQSGQQDQMYGQMPMAMTGGSLQQPAQFMYGEQRIEQINWQAIHQLDLKQAKKQSDIDTLETFLPNILNSTIDEEEFSMLKQETLAKLIEIMQMSLQYFDYTSDYMDNLAHETVDEVSNLERKIAEDEKYLKRSKKQIAKAKQDIQIKKEALVKYKNFVKKKPALKCHICTNKFFQNDDYLDSHMKRRHPQHLPLTAEHPQFGAIQNMLLAQHLQKENIERDIRGDVRRNLNGGAGGGLQQQNSVDLDQQQQAQASQLQQQIAMILQQQQTQQQTLLQNNQAQQENMMKKMEIYLESNRDQQVQMRNELERKINHMQQQKSDSQFQQQQQTQFSGGNINNNNQQQQQLADQQLQLMLQMQNQMLNLQNKVEQMGIQQPRFPHDDDYSPIQEGENENQKQKMNFNYQASKKQQQQRGSNNRIPSQNQNLQQQQQNNNNQAETRIKTATSKTQDQQNLDDIMNNFKTQSLTNQIQQMDTDPNYSNNQIQEDLDQQFEDEGSQDEYTIEQEKEQFSRQKALQEDKKKKEEEQFQIAKRLMNPDDDQQPVKANLNDPSLQYDPYKKRESSEIKSGQIQGTTSGQLKQIIENEEFPEDYSTNVFQQPPGHDKFQTHQIVSEQPGQNLKFVSSIVPSEVGIDSVRDTKGIQSNQNILQQQQQRDHLKESYDPIENSEDTFRLALQSKNFQKSQVQQSNDPFGSSVSQGGDKGTQQKQKHDWELDSFDKEIQDASGANQSNLGGGGYNQKDTDFDQSDDPENSNKQNFYNKIYDPQQSSNSRI